VVNGATFDVCISWGLKPCAYLSADLNMGWFLFEFGVNA
jgi:hypothetical protein